MYNLPDNVLKISRHKKERPETQNQTKTEEARRRRRRLAEEGEKPRKSVSFNEEIKTSLSPEREATKKTTGSSSGLSYPRENGGYRLFLEGGEA